jgi:phosphohistidine phosphatase
VTRAGAARLYLVRHAIAAERGPEWPDDTQRPLTPRGVARMREAVRGLRALGVRPQVIATSPLVRAEQTARLLAAGLGGKPDLVTIPALAPGRDPGAVAAALAGLGDASPVALVGHEPPVFKKGGVCCLDLDGAPREGAASLIWMATPRMLRAIR